MKRTGLHFLFLLFLISALFSTSGCAALGKKWKALISGESEQETAAKNRPTGTTFSQQQNLTPPVYRQYNKRTTRKDFEDRAQLDAKAGSLWVMEGQGAYLFSQNIVRMIGDPIAIRIDGDPASQLKSKADVIKKLLKQIEDRRRKAAGRNLASEKGTPEKSDITSNPQPPGGTPQPAPVNPADPNALAGEDDFKVKLVPTRVVERMVDGNYRVRGTQPFMIGSREYKVIVSGIVKAEDFNDQGISSTQLLDSSFDIVSSKGAAEYR